MNHKVFIENVDVTEQIFIRDISQKIGDSPEITFNVNLIGKLLLSKCNKIELRCDNDKTNVVYHISKVNFMTMSSADDNLEIIGAAIINKEVRTTWW